MFPDSPILTYLLFAVGFVLLIKGADMLVEGASAIAKKLSVSDLVIGLTVVSFGTSAPELVVNILASFSGSSDLAIGNILGSNIANILLILGLTALIAEIHVQGNTMWKEIPLALLAAIVLAVLVNDSFFNRGPGEPVAAEDRNVLGRGDGFVLMAFFVIFVYYTFGLAMSGQDDGHHEEEIKDIPVWRALFDVLAGLAGLVIGGNFIVEGAKFMALQIGLSEAFIGIAVVGVGTSLPEVAASCVAAWRGKADLAIGNVVGSNIFNIFWVLGLSATIRPILYDPALNPDVLMTILAGFALFLAVFVGRAKILHRGEGLLFLLMYFAYLTIRVLYSDA